MVAKDFKNGSTFEMDGAVWKVIWFQHVARPRLAPLINTSLKNVETGQMIEKKFNPGDVVKDASVTKREMQYLYHDDNLYYFMDNETYDQLCVNYDNIKETVGYVKENEMVVLQFVKEKVIALIPPTFVELAITDTLPGVNDSSDRTNYKDATVETGIKVKVPEFCNNGDIVKIDTRTGEYVSRVK